MKHHPLPAKLLLAALTARKPGGRGQEGFSLALVLLVVLSAVVGSLALASLATSANLGSLFQGESAEAREAAEAGLATVISELNKTDNRRLLATANTAWASTAAFQNPCLAQVTATANRFPTALAVGFANNATINNLGGGRSFRVINRQVIAVDPITGARTTPRALVTNPTTGQSSDLNNAQFPGFIRLTVEGRFRGATASVTREFQVVPKCCNQSFGSMPTGLTTGSGTQNLGSDNRACDSSFPRILIGLTGGGLRSTGLNRGRLGTLNANGTVDFTNKPNLVCLRNTASGICGPSGSSQTVDSTPVNTVSLQLPTLPSYPCPAGQTCNNGLTILSRSASDSTTGSTVTTTPQCTSRNCNNTQTETTVSTPYVNRDYLRTAINGSGNLEVQLCNTTNNNASNVRGNPNPPATFSGSCSQTYGPTTVITRTRTTSCNNRTICTQGAWSSPVTTATIPAVNINDFCVRTNDGAFSCRISRLTVYDDVSPSTGDTGSAINTTNDNRRQNNTFYIDTSNAPINLFFNNAWSATALNLNATVDNIGGGNADGQLQQVFCTSPNPSTPCGTLAGANNNNRATVISDNSASPITIGVGDDGFVRDVFIYAPFATFLLNDPDPSTASPGSIEFNFDQDLLPFFQGTLWVNNLQFQALDTNDGTTFLGACCT